MMQSQKSDPIFTYGTRLVDDLEPTMLDFIKTNVNSFNKWDLLRYFYSNWQTIDTAEKIAQYAGRTVPMIERELDDLVDSGVMVKRRLNGVATYSLGSDAQTWALINKFVSACEDKLFRIKVVYHIVQRNHSGEILH
jgi:hypothetical protein